MHGSSLLHSSCFSGSNGPNGFVCDDHVFHFIGREVLEGRPDLAAHHFFVCTGLSLFEALSTAIDDAEFIFQCGLHLFWRSAHRSLEELPALRVAKDDGIGIDGSDHLCRDLPVNAPESSS